MVLAEGGGLLLAVCRCFVRYLCYILPAAAALVVVRFTCTWMPREVFRKLLHAAAFFSAPVVMWFAGDYAQSWLVATLVLLAFGAIVWPVLAAAERSPWFAGLFVQRKNHEIRRSLLVLFWGDAAIVALCWGVLGRPSVAVTAILMWGFGDAAAALVGKKWGRHHTGLPLADPAKTWEGTLAMCAISYVVGFACTVLLSGASPLLGFLPLALASVVGAYVELITHGGYDTITVPVAIACVLLLLGL